MSEVIISATRPMTSRPVWLQKLLDNCARTDIMYRKLKPLKLQGRALIFSLCEKLRCLENGVPGQSYHLFERYMYTHLCTQNPLYSDPALRDAYQQGVMDRCLLLMACCVNLSAKMNSACFSNNVYRVRLALLSLGAIHTIQEIVRTEAEVLKALGFALPIWTSVELSRMLAVELKFPCDTVTAVALIVDLVEYHQEQLEITVLATVNVPKCAEGAGKLTCLDVVAGSIAAAAANEPYSPLAATIVPKLSQLLSLPAPFIQCMRDVILKDILPLKDKARSPPTTTTTTTKTVHEPHRPAILKRKRK